MALTVSPKTAKTQPLGVKIEKNNNNNRKKMLTAKKLWS